MEMNSGLKITKNGFIMRCLELRAAFETVISVIHELEYYQTFAIMNGEVPVPESAYV